MIYNDDDWPWTQLKLLYKHIQQTKYIFNTDSIGCTKQKNITQKKHCLINQRTNSFISVRSINTSQKVFLSVVWVWIQKKNNNVNELRMFAWSADVTKTYFFFIAKLRLLIFSIALFIFRQIKIENWVFNLLWTRNSFQFIFFKGVKRG